MIYSFNVRNEFGDEKQMYLTADNHNQLYRRILSTYGVSKDNVELLAEYKETEDYGYELVKSYTELVTADKDIVKKAKKILAEQSRRSEPLKSD